MNTSLASRLPAGRNVFSRSILGLWLLTASSSIPATSVGWAQSGGIAAATYTEEQADRGQDAYDDNCAGCHGRTLGGDGETPALAGNGFRNRWFSDTALPFFAYISSAMPQQAPGTLEPQMYADIMSFILLRNGYPGGDAELPGDVEILPTLMIPARPE